MGKFNSLFPPMSSHVDDVCFAERKKDAGTLSTKGKTERDNKDRKKHYWTLKTDAQMHRDFRFLMVDLINKEREQSQTK